MKRRAVAQHLAHIASLGLGDRLAIPLMVETLAEVMPASFLNFVWLDENERPADIWLPVFMREPLGIYLDGCDRLDPRHEPTIRSILDDRMLVGANERWNRRPGFHDTILYNRTLRPYGIGAGLDLVLRRRGRAVGILFVNREPRLSTYTADERRFLADLAAVFLQAMDTPGSDISPGGTIVADRAIMLIARSGETVFASETAERLAYQHSGEPVRRTSDRAWRTTLATLATRYHETGHAQVERVTPWGTSIVSVIPPAHGIVVEGLTAIMIERRVPREIAVLRQLGATDLSPRERQVAFELAARGGGANPHDRLGLTRVTWRDYQKRVYEKLQVHSRAELTERLVANDRPETVRPASLLRGSSEFTIQ